MAEKRKIFFIINPKSGNKSARPAATVISNFFKNSINNAEIEFTQHRGHASELAAVALREGFDTVVAVGGDGTVNEVALSVNNSGCSLGIIPVGSGNGLARHHFIPLNVTKALQVLANNKVVNHDSIKINDHYSFNVSGIGFDAHVAHLFGKDGKRGFNSYLKLVMKEFAKYPEFNFTISNNDSSTQTTSVLIAIANASQFGNNAKIAPHADTNDGRVDVTMVRKMKFYELPTFAFKVFNGSVAHSAFAKVMSTEKLTITCEKETPLHVDGEPAGYASQFEITTLKSTLKLIVP